MENKADLYTDRNLAMTSGHAPTKPSECLWWQVNANTLTTGQCTVLPCNCLEWITHAIPGPLVQLVQLLGGLGVVIGVVVGGGDGGFGLVGS